MNVKKVYVFVLCILVLFIVSPSYVFAEETAVITVPETETDTAVDEETEKEAGVTPDSWLYSIEQMIESVQLSLTFSAEGKAELLIEFANERLAEAQIMAEKEQAELMGKVIEAYTRTVKQANYQVQTIVESQEDTTEPAEETITEVSEETIAQVEEQTARINRIIENIELIQNDGDKIVIKLTASLPETQAEQIQEVIKAEVQNVVAAKAYVAVKKNFVESAKQYAAAKNELALAKNSGDEAAIQAAQEKIDQAAQYKEDLKDLKEEVKDLKKEVKKETKVIVKEQRKITKEIKKENDVRGDEQGEDIEDADSEDADIEDEEAQDTQEQEVNEETEDNAAAVPDTEQLSLQNTVVPTFNQEGSGDKSGSKSNGSSESKGSGSQGKGKRD